LDRERPGPESGIGNSGLSKLLDTLPMDGKQSAQRRRQHMKRFNKRCLAGEPGCDVLKRQEHRRKRRRHDDAFFGHRKLESACREFSQFVRIACDGKEFDISLAKEFGNLEDFRCTPRARDQNGK